MGNVLDHLLKIEAEASAMVFEAQAEADRRISENEEKNRLCYEERLKLEIQKQESLLETEKKRINDQYQKALDDYREEISRVNINEQRFSVLLNEYLKNG
ncbi:MAG: hypothetical protein FWD26_01025 [Treponema sp.]|nr:hypothetical protein [Treponema sp.]